jgi:outer membrane beta-barrel protein
MPTQKIANSRFSRWLAPIFGAAAALTTLASSTPASAQEYQLTGPLAGASSSKNLRLYRKNRIEVAPTASFTLLDEYRRTILFGGRLQYNLADWIGIGVWGAYGAISSTTDLTDQIDQVAPRNSRTASNVNHGAVNPDGTYQTASFADQTAKITYVIVPQVQLVPLRGKFAIFQKIFVDTDAYIHLGLGIVGLQERGFCGAAGQVSCVDPSSFALASRTAISPTFGLGLNFYITNFLSLGVEYRALPFSWNRAGFDSRGSGSDGNTPDQKIDEQDRTFKFNQMMTISLGFSFPTAPKLSE